MHIRDLPFLNDCMCVLPFVGHALHALVPTTEWTLRGHWRPLEQMTESSKIILWPEMQSRISGKVPGDTMGRTFFYYGANLLNKPCPPNWPQRRRRRAHVPYHKPHKHTHLQLKALHEHNTAFIARWHSFVSEHGIEVPRFQNAATHLVRRSFHPKKHASFPGEGQTCRLTRAHKFFKEASSQQEKKNHRFRMKDQRTTVFGQTASFDVFNRWIKSFTTNFMLWQGWRFREALVLYLSKFKLLKTLPFTEVGMPSKLFQNPLAIAYLSEYSGTNGVEKFNQNVLTWFEMI